MCGNPGYFSKEAGDHVALWSLPLSEGILLEGKAGLLGRLRVAYVNMVTREVCLKSSIWNRQERGHGRAV